MIKRIVKAWDGWIYRRAYHSLRRICRRTPVFGYLMKLHIDGFVAENPIPESLEASVMRFFESLPKKK